MKRDLRSSVIVTRVNGVGTRESLPLLFLSLIVFPAKSTSFTSNSTIASMMPPVTAAVVIRQCSRCPTHVPASASSIPARRFIMAAVGGNDRSDRDE